MAKVNYSDELEKFRQYLKSDHNEDAKRPLLYPLFNKLFKERFKIESDSSGADIYIEGQLLVEAKTDFSQWLDGFYQALHYQKMGLVFNTIIVVANRFVGIWKLKNLPEYATIISKTSDPQKAPNTIGKENARKTQQNEKVNIRNSAFYWLEPKDLEGDIFGGARNLTTEIFEILKILNNLESDRLQINTHNFINSIEQLKMFFEKPIDAVHAFYSMISCWDITSTIAASENGECRLIGHHGHAMSETISIHPRYVRDFRKFVENHYIFTNEGSGLTVDYYFSRFDEVMAKLNPEYVKQHGIFFTDNNLSRFALWFAKYHFPGNINEDYIVLDPAGGSGNLISCWRGKLKHKIVSELQPDLLKIIERRLKADVFHIETGFTIIPKTIENKGLNFLDCSAENYLLALNNELKNKSLSIDKPLAFLLNPPYKNTDENQKVREENESHYEINPDILALTGEDAGKERYLAFLGQILNICKFQNQQNAELQPIVMIFTPTSWLIPRPTYLNFRKIWDKHFSFHSGFIITGNEFFEIDGKWPLAFTIWVYDQKEEDQPNTVEVNDLTHLKHIDLNINWNVADEELKTVLNSILSNSKSVRLDNSRGNIKEWTGQKMYDFKRDPTQTELKSGLVYGGLPIKDERRSNKKTYGISQSEFVGFMDDQTPCRIKQTEKGNVGSSINRVWFYLDNRIQKVNLLKSMNGPSDNRSFCAFDLKSAKFTFTWYSIGKSIVGNYPIWANMYDIWPPQIKPELENYWYSLCFAFVLAENRCVVTKFEKDNPLAGAPEVFVDNPLCSANKESFWSSVLDSEIVTEPPLAKQLVDKIKELYKHWNKEYCKGQWLYHVGLQDEPYFKYFDYADFLTPYSGLIQIRKYAQNEGVKDLLGYFSEISELTKKVKAEIYRLVVVEFGYFE